LVEAFRGAWVCDDIFITFRYVDQLLAGRGVVFNPGERVEGYTHFLWLIVLAALRRLGLDPAMLARYLPIAAFAAVLAVLLWRALRSGRGWLALPIAAWGFALHKDAQVFASSGLETSFFTLCVLCGLLAVTAERSRIELAAWFYALATLLRPEGLLYAVPAGAYVFWRQHDVKSAARYAGVWAALVLPFFLWRLAYYHSPLPNTYYAKSAGAAWWSQGWTYTSLYFGIYAVLLACLGLAAVLWLFLLRRHPERLARQNDLLLLGSVQILLTVLYVTRLGGDFMFARFYIPMTPLFYLILEETVRRAGKPWLAAAAAVLVVGGTLQARLPRQRTFPTRKMVQGIVCEPNFYPRTTIDELRDKGVFLGHALEGTDARVEVLAGQDMIGYYGRLAYVVEANGLTETDIAREPLACRRRPGHEKFVSEDYLVRHHVQFRLLWGPHRARQLELYRVIRFGAQYGSIVYYERPLMDVLRTRPGMQFVDFPAHVDEYARRAGKLAPARLLEDYGRFYHFYFEHNDDPERFARLRAVLQAAGITPTEMLAAERAVPPPNPSPSSIASQSP
jgi:phage terminase large subunit-like protein